MFAGDISFSGPVQYYARHGCHTYNDSFSQVAADIRGADFAVGNLESPFVTKEMLAERYQGKKSVYLDADVESASSLR